MEAFGHTDTGRKRQHNEDRFMVRRFGVGWLVAVADGMGGEAGGDEAAQCVVDVLQAIEPGQTDVDESALKDALRKAQAKILEKASGDDALEGMGTTATVAVIRDGRACFAHVGDSRLYRLRDGRLRQMSKDHSFLQALVDDGTMTPEEAAEHPFRNVLDQCVGCAEFAPDTGAFALHPGDRLLVCSDGLYRELSDMAMGEMLAGASSAEDAAHSLIRAAVEKGGRDNVTAVVLLA